MTVEYNEYLENVDQDDILDWQNKVYKLVSLKNFLILLIQFCEIKRFLKLFIKKS